MAKTIKDRILDLAKAYAAANGEQPNYVSFTPEEELELAALSPDEIGGPLASQIFSEGVRIALPTIFGMDTHWDADAFKVGFAGPTLNRIETRELSYEEMLSMLPSGKEDGALPS